MTRTVWKGALSFGLVNVPVGLYPATQDKAVHLHQLEEGTSDRIHYRKVNERTGEEVPNERIAKGVDLGDGEYVLLSDEELEAAAPDRSRLVEITGFVDLTDIDPVYYRSTYYLAPEGEAADKAYALLRQVMHRAEKVAIGTMVMRNKEYLVAIRPADRVLLLETMYFADEIRSPQDDLPDLPLPSEVSDREVRMAAQLLESMERPWDPEEYEDTHRRQLEAVIEEKRQGNRIVVRTGSSPGPTEAVDLMEVLSASIDSVRTGRTAGGAAPRRRARKRSGTTGTSTQSGAATGGKKKKTSPSKPRRKRAA